MDIASFTSGLKEKAGPLPEWVWIVGIAGVGYFVWKKKQSTANPSTTDSSTTSADQSSTDPTYAGALLTAQYDELNALGLNTSQIGTLNSNVPANTAALGANTTAETGNTAAVAGNTTATAANTTATNTNTATVAKAPVVTTPPKAGAPAPAKPATKVTYTVKAGDNLSAIATRYKTTWQAIYAANKAEIGSNPDLIKPGQKLVIP